MSRTTSELIRSVSMLVAGIEEAEGEVTNDFENALDVLIGDMEDKVKGCLHVAHRMVAEEKHLRAMEVDIARRRRIISNQRAGVLERVIHLRRAAEELGEDFKVKNSEYTVYMRGSSSVEVAENLDDVDVRFLVEQPPKVDKAAALKELKKGEEIAGLSLKTNTSLQWSLF